VEKWSEEKISSTKNEGSNILVYILPYFVILSIWLVFFLSLVTSMYAAPLQQAIAQTTTTATKTNNSNAFLTYENNSTLGIKIH
jgi:hypothetical protein